LREKVAREAGRMRGLADTSIASRADLPATAGHAPAFVWFVWFVDQAF
jgi:hypothetical protein